MPPKPMIDRSRRGPYDEIATPAVAFDYLHALIQYWNRPSINIWECAPGDRKLTHIMATRGWNVIEGPGDFLTTEPNTHYEAIITNPPFSKKYEFLKRAVGLDKPFAFLLPVTTPGSRECQYYLKDCNFIYLPKRIDFTGKGAPWFAVMWVTHRMIFDDGGTFRFIP